MSEHHETTEQASEPASARNADPAASQQTPSASEPASREKQKAAQRRKMLIGGAGAVVLVAVLAVGIPWIPNALNTVSTDDAYVNGHVTFVAARVRGQVARVLVDDNNRVRRGDVEIAGPERAPFYEIVARYLKAVGDPREVVSDKAARYFRGLVEDRSLVPLGDARLGRIGFDEWHRRSAR
jgi:uncharacterized protein YbjT (DUF2867 family)